VAQRDAVDIKHLGGPALVKAAVFKHAKNVYALHFVQTFARRAQGGALARMWTEDSALRLRKRMPVAMAAALAKDGGIAVDDITAHLPNEDWAALTKEFFLS
jgi:hypothetical protein